MNYYSIILGAVSLGLLWAVMTMGVFITYRILDYADLTVEGSLVTGAAIAAKLITDGTDPFVALAAAFVGGCAAGCVTGLLNTAMKIPGLLAGILSMIALYSVNIRIMGKANITLLKSRTVYDVLENIGISNDIAVLIFAVVLNAALVGILYWFFTTQLGYARTPMVEKMALESNPADPESAIRDIAVGVPMKRLADPKEVGELFAFLGSDESSYITGAQFVIDGGSTLPETMSMGTN